MELISEIDFSKICSGLAADKESIVQHNPIGNEDETMLWMLLSCLHSYLSLSDPETPCFTGRPDANMYLEAVHYVLKNRRVDDFDAAPYIRELLSK